MADRIHQELSQAIFTGEIPSGARLVESELALQKGVSRTPVREALQRLVSEGLVYSIPRTGYFVEGMSEYEIQDLFDVRMAIETLAAKWAATRITSEELDNLESNVTRLKQALRIRNEAEIVTADREFHEIIYWASGSRILNEISKVIALHILKFRIMAILVPEIGERVLDCHREIFQAMQSRDVKKAEAAVASHLRMAQKDILDCISQDIKQKVILR